MDAWLAPAGLRGGQILEAWSCTSPPATPSSPLPPLISRVPNIRDGLGSSVVSPCYAVSGGLLEVSSYLLLFLVRVFRPFWPPYLLLAFFLFLVFRRNSGLSSSHFGARSLCHPLDFSQSCVPVSMRTRRRRWSAGAPPRLHEDPLSAMERGRTKSGVTGSSIRLLAAPQCSLRTGAAPSLHADPLSAMERGKKRGVKQRLLLTAGITFQLPHGRDVGSAQTGSVRFPAPVCRSCWLVLVPGCFWPGGIVFHFWGRRPENRPFCCSCA